MTPQELPLQDARRRVHRLGLSGVLTVALVAAGCAGPASGTPAASSVAASPSTADAATETPIPTLEATTEEAAVAPSGAITITVGPGPSFTPDQLTAPAGTVVFFLDTQQETEVGALHNMLIATETGDLPLAKSATLDSDHSVIFTVHGLQPGTYQFWCAFEGHLAAGMKGTLTVT